MINFWSVLWCASLVAVVVSLIGVCNSKLARMAGTKKRWLILAVLGLVIAYLSGGAWWRNRQVEQCCEALQDMGAAVELYAEGHSAYPKSLNELIPAYMDELPTCPGQTAGQGWKYEVNAEFFTIYCQGHNHPGLGGTPENYPCFTAESGVLKG